MINHRNVLSTIILRQDDQPKAVNMFGRFQPVQLKDISPIQIYKEIPKNIELQLQIPKIKTIFTSLVEFAPLEKTDTSEILYLGLLKDLLQRILRTEKDLRFQFIIDSLETKFGHSVIHVKDTALKILADIFSTYHEHVVELLM